MWKHTNTHTHTRVKTISDDTLTTLPWPSHMHPLKLPLSNSACRCADLPWPIHCFVSVDLRFVLAISSPTEVRPGPSSHTTTVQSNPFELWESTVLSETSFQLLSTQTRKGPCTLTAGNRERKPIYSTASPSLTLAAAMTTSKETPITGFILTLCCV